MLRRLIAVMLGLCVSVAFAEPMIADRCDDIPAKLSIGTGSTDAAPLAIAHGVDFEPSPDRSPLPDGHTLHLCHCAHVHGSTLTARHTIPDRFRIVTVDVPSRTDRLPPSVSGEPQLRPPRVLTA